MSLLHGNVAERVIGAFYAVYNSLGSGFSERFYHKALIVELTRRGLNVESEKPIHVHYQGRTQSVQEFSQRIRGMGPA